MKNNGSLLPQISKILMFVFLTASTIFSQTTYYISNSQGNDSNIGTSETSPWKSLDKLHSSWNQIGPGDKILFKRGDEWAPSDIGGRVGVIQLPTAKNGSDGSPIVLDAYGSGDRPIISKQNVSGYSETIRGQSNAYFTFENLSFRGTVNFRTFDHAQGTHHITILNCDFQQAPMVFQGLYREDYTQLYPLHTIEIAYNTFYDNGHLTQDAISMANIPPGPRDGRKNVWVHHNQFYKIGEEAIDIGGGSGHVVEYNFISGTTTNGIKMHSQSSRLDSFVVRGNVILHVGMGVINGGFTDLPNPMSNGNALAFISTGHGKVYNNVISSRYCFTITESDQSAVTYGKMEDVEIFNNIFHGVTQISYVKSGTDAHGDYFGTNVWGTEPPLIDRGIVFKNNIYYPTTYEPGKLVRFWQMSGGSQQVNDAWTVTNANFQTAWVDRFNTIDEISDNPGFVNPTWASFYDYGDYSLQTSSPGIDAGVNITGYNIDIAGNPVPQGITTDIGAYELRETDSTPPKINSINVIDFSNLVIQFSESIQEENAEDIKNYSINPEADIILLSAELQSDSRSVFLTTTQQPEGSYVLAANNIFDLVGNIIDPEANTISYTISDAIDTLVIAQYDFTQGETPGLINDISGGDNQVDLIIESEVDVEWLEPYGISINSPTKIVSKHPAKKITDACIQTGEISVAVWLKPHTLNQNGPARIASLSENANVRNFTLGHGGTDGADDVFDFRLRTTESNSNGLPSVTTQPGFMTTSTPNHLVYTRNRDGLSKIFINSVEVQSAEIGGDFSNWDNSFHFIIGNEFTGERPWLGEIYGLSIYDVALSNHLIDSLYSVNVITNTNDEFQELPKSFFLEQNYPNPFNPSTKIKFKIPSQSVGVENKSNVPVKLTVYDILGNKIVTLIDEHKSPGIYEVEFDGKDLSSGIYFYKIDAGIFQSTKKMILLK